MPAIVRRGFLKGMALVFLPQTVWAQTAKPKIGFIGAGKIGGQLATLWAHAGYQVMVSARDLDAMKKLAAEIGPNARAGTSAEAAAFGEIVVVTVPYSALPQVGTDYASQLKGKIVLDTCNPNATRDGDMSKDALEKGTGVMDPIYLHGTRLVRAFTTVGANVLTTSANRPGELIGIPLTSDDKAALVVASRLVRDAGFEPVIVGDLSTSRRFDTGQTPIYGKALPASEVRKALNVTSGAGDP